MAHRAGADTTSSKSNSLEITVGQFERHFTLGEADAMLPWVRSIFEEIHRILAEIVSPKSAADVAEQHGLPRGHSNGNGHDCATPAAPPWTALPDPEKIQLINGLLKGLVDKGIVIQDVERGLVDFPGWRDNEEILLCYELRDGDRIVAWHDLHAGFAGRQPLDGRVAR